ncbi:MAG TPA: ABC transporter permease [Pyrinomonadaceae bacterium]|jgi:putative ABC transport system permease protein|nr:ABC transporter permease [Pyrinomonadaceae bacterium]
MDSLFKDIRFGVRGLLKHPSFTAIAVITLALGIGANTAIFSVLYAVLLRPLPYPDSDRVVRIEETEGRGGMGVSPPNFVDFQQQNQTFESVAAYSSGTFILTGGSEPVRIQSSTVSHNLFSLLKVNPLIGRTFSAADESENQTGVAILSHGLWLRCFGGDPGLVGKQITLDSKSYLVIGVMPPDFEFPIQSDRVDVWVPLSLPADMSQLRGAHYLDVVGRMKPNVSLAAAHKDLESIASGLARQFPDLVPGKTTVVPLKKDLVGEIQTYLWMLAVAVALVLLIATANVASLMLARASERRKEIALRLALGATRFRILRQLLTESLTLSLLGGLGGLLVLTWGTNFLISLGPADVPRLQSAHLNAPVFLFALSVSLISGILFGLAPWHSATHDLQSTLKEGAIRSATAPRQGLRKILVVTEVTLALLLLCGAGLLIRTLWKLNAVRPGFDPEQVLVAEVVLPKTKYANETRQGAFFQQLLERIKTVPDVESAAGTTNLPLSGTNMVFMASVDGSDSRLPASFRSISPDYFQVMRVPLLRGRYFDDRDTASSPAVVVINESMARQIAPSGEAIGKRIKHGFKARIAEVVGVVGDVKYAGLDKETKPEMYAPFAQGSWPFLRLVVRSKSDPLSLAAEIRGEVQSIDKDQPVDKITTMRSVMNSSIRPRRFYMQLLGSFAGMAFILASIGIYGLVSYSVAQRTREIGIRMALGASRSHVLRLVLTEGFGLTVVGLVLGLAGAFASTRVLRNLLFEVGPTDPFTFIAVSLSLLVVALLACYIPARRATKVDPLVALRYE